MQTEDKVLKIYNASAGSGKTYHLVKEYIKLLVKEVHSKSFSNIIAMTFTNKAALEMKERIIKALDEISSPQLFKNNASELVESLQKDLNLSKQEIENRCSLVLTNILHQYEDFHVMTIDKFNLRLIRSFSRDLDLSNDFEVIMDEAEVIEKIVDDLLNQLGNENSSHLNKLLLKYAESKVDEGESWNFRQKLIEFGKILRIERNATKVKHLMQMDFSIERFGSVIAQRKNIDSQFKLLAQDILKIVNETKLDQEFLPGKSGTMNGMLKIAHATSFDLDENFISKPLIKALDSQLNSKQIFPDEVKLKVRNFLDFYNSSIQEYAVISLYLQNFFNMALLQYMAKALAIHGKSS